MQLERDMRSLKPYSRRTKVWADISPQEIPAGVVGMGEMGTGIAACLLMAGHTVMAVEPHASARRQCVQNLRALLKQCKREKSFEGDPDEAMGRLSLSTDFSILAASQIVLESVTEDLKTKRAVIGHIESVVSRQALIGSNTSAIPITLLQQGAVVPGRVLGMHWGDPAHATRFMEVICGKRTHPKVAECALALARTWGKEPSLLIRDIRGFIANRIMYAAIREALYLVESGIASVADVDRSVRNDMGYWIGFGGLFRYMDLTGLPAYASVMRDLFPELCSTGAMPNLVRKLVASGARGTANRKGFYRYTPSQAKRWEQQFVSYTSEIRALLDRYPENLDRCDGSRENATGSQGSPWSERKGLIRLGQRRSRRRKG